MGKNLLRGKDLQKLGLCSDKAKSLAIQLLSKHFKYLTKTEQSILIQKVILSPQDFFADERLQELAFTLQPQEKTSSRRMVILNDNKADIRIFGKKHISGNAVHQMQQAMRLPIAHTAALMPDAHQGYGLPIGGVLATKNAVIPYGVGMDIGCRMSLSIYDVRPPFLIRYSHQLKTALKTHTDFGIKQEKNFNYEHPVMERSEFREIALARKLHAKAWRQLGTSGSGNHFAEFGIVELFANNQFGLPANEYLGILTHSGSRGFGAEIARTYTQIAMQQLDLPKGFQQLAWLDLDKPEGQEYWALMNLAGDYAKACHDMIHQALAKELGLKQVAKIENHHNFAWKETLEDGQEYIIHRKGATPASKGTAGIIPGSMTAPGYIVRGKGESSSLNSASHGAGRKLSRAKAKDSITRSELNKYLRQKKVTLIGGNTDEAPFAYKDIDEVMQAQQQLVEVEGSFLPQIVRMDKS